MMIGFAAQRWILLLSIGCLALAIPIATYQTTSRSGPRVALSRTQLLSVLFDAAQKSAEDGLGGLAALHFSVPSVVVPYKQGFTVGELRDAIAASQAERPEQISTDYDFVSFVNYFANSLLSSSEGPYRSARVNEATTSGMLSIWFIDPQYLPRQSPLDVSTCAYVGYADLIVCNTRLIQLVMVRLAALTRSLSVGLAYCDGGCPDSYRMNLAGNLDDLRALMRQNFMVWLIGHEIGHAVRHRDWAVRSGTPLHFNVSYDWREAEADNFVGEAVSKLPPLEAAFAPLLLEYADQEFVRLYNELQGHLDMPIAALNEPADPLRLKFTAEHALFLRALRMLDTIVRRNPDALGQIYFRPIGSDLGFVSTFKPVSYVQFLQAKTLARASAVVQPWTIWAIIFVLSILSISIVTLVRKQRDMK